MMKCEIIRDLIPLYLDKVCSEDSRKLVEEHLAECSECRKYMKELETELEAVKQKKEEDLDEKRVWPALFWNPTILPIRLTFISSQSFPKTLSPLPSSALIWWKPT